MTLTAAKTFPNLIGGESLDTSDRNRNINPSNTADVIGEFARGTSADVDRAVAVARAAFTRWSQTTPQQRFDVLDRAGSDVLARKEELGRLLAREQGKPLADGIGEAARAGAILKFFAGEAVRPHGEKVDSVRPGIEVDVTREPLGVVSVIAPWNFPLAIPAWKIAPALAFGNTVVFKPAELVPGCAWALAEILSRAGLPSGTFNLVMGRGRDIGDTLLSDPRVAAVTFTGSEATGRKVAAACIARRGTMAKFQLEM